MSKTLPASWSTTLRDFESRLAETLRQTADRDGARPPERLLAAMNHTLLAGGKRLRPLLVLESARAARGETLEKDAIAWSYPAALAVEYVHTYSLIHDDLPALDDDSLRRGRPTAHIAFDEATAILAGDALLAEAFGLVAGAKHRAADQVRELSLAAGSAGMVGGQMDDILGEGSLLDGDALRAIHARKTGRLFRACCLLGALSVDAPAQHLEALDQYAAAFGLAFQIADDVLDVTGDVAQRGKNSGGDAAREKSTYVRAYGLDGAQRLAREQMEIALAALQPLGPGAAPLAALARYAVERQR